MGVICRIGSLEKVFKYQRQHYTVICRIGSLEMNHSSK